MRPSSRFHLRHVIGLLNAMAVGLASHFICAASEPKLAELSVVELEASLADLSPKALSFRLEGTVRAVVPGARVLALQDASGTALLELPSLSPEVTNGQRVVIEANPGNVSRTFFGLRIDDVPVVDHDGLHSEGTKSGKSALEQGLNPIRLTWFNGLAEFALNLEYQGPGIPRQTVPAAVLWSSPDGTTNEGKLGPGLRYKAYQKTAHQTIPWLTLPDFSRFTPLAEGLATNFSADYRTGDQNCGLAFDGFIKVPQAGFYTFHLSSDDGSRLYLGRSTVTCRVVPPAASTPSVEGLDRASNSADNNQWIRLEGEVAFVAEDEFGLEVEMNAAGRRVSARVLDRGGWSAGQLLRRTIRVEGVTRRPAISGQTIVCVPGAMQVQIKDPSSGIEDGTAKELLTTAAQVQQLKSADAGRHIPAKIRGVVIYAARDSVVLNDFSGGVFISARALSWDQQPSVGEFWEIEGTTDAGLFSPVVTADRSTFLGYAPMPEPVRPIRDQLMTGNLDAHYVELRGVITSLSSNEIGMLLPDGRVSLVEDPERPLPEIPGAVAGINSFVGSVVRIRGCFAPLVDTATRQVVAGRFMIYPATVELEEARPTDPFLLPAKTPGDLKWFDARGTVLQRTKLSGQVVHATAREWFVESKGAGFRVYANDAPPVQPGDMIEAVGFPKLGGASPVLLEAQTRVVGREPLSRPLSIAGSRLLDRTLDSTLVTVAATLIRDAVDRGERVFELQSGPYHFAARCKADARKANQLLPGSELQLTGVYVVADDEGGRLGANDTPFELLMDSEASVVVLRQPSWWTIRRAILVVSALGGLLCVSSIWVFVLRRTVQQRTAQLLTEIEERQRAEHRRAIEQERIRMARDLHDELGAGLTEVGLLGSLANTTTVAPEAKSRYLGQLTNVAHDLVAALDEIVWAVNPDYDTVPSLVSYFSLYAESFLSLAGIKCRLQVMEAVPERPLDSGMRHGLLCVFKEALNNVVRHANATEVQTAFDWREEQLVISVTDNGRGFAVGPESPGKDGLRGLKERMHSLGGECEITSQPGRGTRVVIRLRPTQNQNGQGSHR